jgi:DNA-binding response OmpR family regulator
MVGERGKNAMKARILLVDDELEPLRKLVESLEFEGYEVITAEDYDMALYRFDECQPDLVILDIAFGSNKWEGLDILKRIRDRNEAIGVVMLTGRSDVRLSEKSYALKANDFVRKSAPTEDILALVGDRLSYVRPGIEPIDGYIEIDRRNNTVCKKADGEWQEVHLSPIEFEILDKLISARPHVVEREALMRCFSSQSKNPSGTLNRFISGLRKKLEPDPRNPQYILLSSGVGYYFKSDR